MPNEFHCTVANAFMATLNLKLNRDGQQLKYQYQYRRKG
jgi:hypothetical protein